MGDSARAPASESDVPEEVDPEKGGGLARDSSAQGAAVTFDLAARASESREGGAVTFSLDESGMQSGRPRSVVSRTGTPGSGLRTPMTPGTRSMTSMARRTAKVAALDDAMAFEPPMPERSKRALFPPKRLEELKEKTQARAKNLRARALVIINTPTSYWIILADEWLTVHLSHAVRYLCASVLCQLFPLVYASAVYGANKARQCDRAVDRYILGTVYVSSGRCLISALKARRIMNRGWPGQEFGQALGQVWNFTEKQGMDRDPCLGGRQLNVLIVLGVFVDVGWWFFGFFLVCLSERALCADRTTVDGGVLVGYQALSVFFLTMGLDLVLPYFNLEFDAEVDTLSNKKSSSDLRREARRKTERARNARLRERDKARKVKVNARVISVKGKSSSDQGADPWWMTPGAKAPPNPHRVGQGAAGPAAKKKKAGEKAKGTKKEATL